MPFMNLVYSYGFVSQVNLQTVNAPVLFLATVNRSISSLQHNLLCLCSSVSYCYCCQFEIFSPVQMAFLVQQEKTYEISTDKVQFDWLLS